MFKKNYAIDLTSLQYQLSVMIISTIIRAGDEIYVLLPVILNTLPYTYAVGVPG